MFDFPEWLQRQIESKKWTQAQLAHSLGCTPSYVSYLAGGRDMPSPENLKKLEEIFGVRPRGKLFAHKMMNKIEKIGALKAFTEDPSLLAVHGIEVAPLVGRATVVAAKVSRLAQEERWFELASYCLEIMNSKGSSIGVVTSSAPSMGAPMLNDSGTSETPVVPKARRGRGK
jgi:transcriptional regulator with XRE-family HTH domain